MVPLTQTIQAICTLLPLASVSTMTWKWPFPLFLQQSLSITISIASIEITFLNKCMLCLVAQSCPTLCDPMDCSLTGSSVHGDSQGMNTVMGCHALFQGIFLTQGSNLCLLWLLHCRWVLYLWATGEAHWPHGYSQSHIHILILCLSEVEIKDIQSFIQRF